MKKVEVNVEERIDLFLKNKTYVFIKLIRESMFNGYIISKDNNSIKFVDDKLGEIPILINEINIIDYSKRGAKNDS